MYLQSCYSNMRISGSTEVLNTVQCFSRFDLSLCFQQEKKVISQEEIQFSFLSVLIFGHIVSWKCRSTVSVCSLVHKEPPLLFSPANQSISFFLRLKVWEVPVLALIILQFNVAASHASAPGMSLLRHLAFIIAFSRLVQCCNHKGRSIPLSKDTRALKCFTANCSPEIFQN